MGRTSDVVLCGHSYGGFVITGAADRVPEQIRSLVYLDAFVPEDGECVFDNLPPELAQQLRTLAQPTGRNVSPIPAERFNVNPRDAAWVNSQCTPQSIASFEERIRLNRLLTHDATHILATSWDDSPFVAARERANALMLTPSGICELVFSIKAAKTGRISNIWHGLIQITLYCCPLRLPGAGSLLGRNRR
jgi:pimeloyl-ACP methyl ester carboxylesterase